jgi:predicted Zn-dependent protease
MALMDLSHQRLLVAAQGYSELELPDLALAELAQIPEENQRDPAVLETRLSVLMQAQRYRDAIPCGRELCQLAPERTSGFIHVAYCLHELGNTQAARELLLSGPPALKAEATYHYNLACYEAVLGNIPQAQAHLDVSFAMDRKLKDIASSDPDLAPLRSGSGFAN